MAVTSLKGHHGSRPPRRAEEQMAPCRWCGIRLNRGDGWCGRCQQQEHPHQSWLPSSLVQTSAWICTCGREKQASRMVCEQCWYLTSGQSGEQWNGWENCREKVDERQLEAPFLLAHPKCPLPPPPPSHSGRSDKTQTHRLGSWGSKVLRYSNKGRHSDTHKSYVTADMMG